jgi:hypothetical protein
MRKNELESGLGRVCSRCAAFATIALACALAHPRAAAGAADPEPDRSRAQPQAPPPDARAEKAPQPSPPREADVPVYHPPKPTRGSFPRNLTGAATRGHGSADAPLVLALAPDHLGLTVNGQPNLYWYLEKDSAIRVDFTLIDEQSVNPLLEITVAGPLRGGVHVVRLADHGLSLEPGRWYEWSVSVVTGGRDPSEDRISRGFITRTPVPAGVTEQLEKRGPQAAVNVFAEAGLWYDAITALSVGIETQEQKAPLRRARAALLDQVGLGPVAQYDRNAAP